MSTPRTGAANAATLLAQLTPEQQLQLCWLLLDRSDAGHPATSGKDCWIWSGRTRHGHHPTLNAMRIIGIRKTLLARRVAAWLGGIDIQPGQPIMTTCGERHCINPAHMVPSTNGAIAKQAAAKGAYSMPDRCAAIAAGRRASASAKLNMEKARAIRASTLPCAQEAALHGVHPSLISRIRRREAWRDHSNPFAGLLQP